MNKDEYVIIGDTENFEGCLVRICGTSRQDAEEILNQMLTNPDKNDLKLMEGHKNFRIERVKEKECWWNQDGLD